MSKHARPSSLSRARLGGSPGVVEVDAEGVAAAGAYAADAVAKVRAVEATRAFLRAVTHREDHRIATADGCHLDARLPARPLLGQHERPAGEVAARLGQQHGRLQGKHLVAVEILVQAVVVAGTIGRASCRARVCQYV